MAGFAKRKTLNGRLKSQRQLPSVLNGLKRKLFSDPRTQADSLLPAQFLPSALHPDLLVFPIGPASRPFAKDAWLDSRRCIGRNRNRCRADQNDVPDQIESKECIASNCKAKCENPHGA
jgi:hypothetical protein